MREFGQSAALKITESVNEVEVLQRVRDEREVEQQTLLIERAIKLLPAPGAIS
jgi:hypothetical protein